MTFRDLGLEATLLESIQLLGFETPTPIQIQCFPPADAKKNIVGIAQTGTGKTLAFLLPIVNRIYRENIEDPTCIILAPTRELCVQISEELQRLARVRPIRVATVYGGEAYGRQEKELADRPHFIVATPGRLIDFMKQKKVPVESISVLVLDEADRMFDMGFIRDIRYVMRHIPEGSQVMLFTATMSYYVMRLITDFMAEPEQIKIDTDRVEVEKIDQKLYHLGLIEKMPYLVNLIRGIDGIKAIVFTNSRHRVQDIVRLLSKYGIHATGISSLLDQKKRIHLLKSFKMGRYNVLVATDVASRGLDIDDITHVFNYDLPQDPESYVHRIGRTARAGKEGNAISFCSEMDYECLPRIEVLLEHRIPVVAMDPEYLKFPAPSPVTIPHEDRLTEAAPRPRRSEEESTGDRSAGGRRKRRRKRRGPEEGSSGGLQAARSERPERPARDDRGPGNREGLAQKNERKSPNNNHSRNDRGRQAEPAASEKGSRRDRQQTGDRNDRSNRNDRGRPNQAQPQGRHNGTDERQGGKNNRRRRRGGRGGREDRQAQTAAPKKSLIQKIIGFFKKG